MALLDDIIEMAANDKEPIANLLRKCLILERQLPNEKSRQVRIADLKEIVKGQQIRLPIVTYAPFRGL
jgi:hypothetical protein